MTKSHYLQDPFLNALRKEKNSGLDLPCQWNKIAGICGFF